MLLRRRAEPPTVPIAVAGFGGGMDAMSCFRARHSDSYYSSACARHSRILTVGRTVTHTRRHVVETAYAETDTGDTQRISAAVWGCLLSVQWKVNLNFI